MSHSTSLSRELDRLRTGLHRGRLALLGLSRGWIAAMLAAAVLALAAAIAPWTFSTGAMLEEIAGQIEASSGLRAAAKGRSTFSLLPRPHIAIDDVAFADPSFALTIEAERLRGNVRLLPLLTGRLELANAELLRPRIRIALDRKPMTASGAAARAAAARPSTPEAETADRAPLGSVAILSGAVAVVFEDGREERIDMIDATLDWSSVGAPATLDAAFSWRGERPRAMLWFQKPGALLRGEASPMMMRIDSVSLRMEADGVAQSGPKPRFTGRLSASSPSLRDALRLADVSAPLPGRFENVQIAAKASVGLRDFQLSDLHFSADENDFEGVFGLRHDGDRPILHGTLASSFVSLKPMIADAPALIGPDGQWSREPFVLPDIKGADVDLRLSAARARLLRLNMEDAAISLMLRAGRIEVALTEAQAYKGTIKGRVTLAANAAGVLELHANAQTQAVDAGALAWDLAARPDLGGNLDANIVLDAAGDSPAEMMRALDGRASLVLNEGEVGGIDLERALRRADKRPLSSALDIRSGHTLVDRAGATIKISKGAAAIEDGEAHGPGFSLAFAGSARIPERGLAIKAEAREADAAGAPRDNGVQLGFELSGAWDEPSFALDAAALIKRSGAAAPLLPRER
ncbi:MULTISPECIES: AsmA family protein [Methylosinus]|uniref:AsmA family protein n=1 Tax=Methylosinus trichosporium (strain ATCC 35070 / NCIMB 11131 / UNIQEM 75 / OB3b) TaxID=595536 RepID=A0A2D2CZA5_METT3|nr:MULTISPECIES: AsmA family protein [Methylosinus]ATQ68024.1 AsmA family protein [Methylosinus trichosporium OB3b]